MANCSNRDIVFKTSRASAKAYLRTKGAIDQYNNIIDESLFRRWGSYINNHGREKYSIEDKLVWSRNIQGENGKWFYQVVFNDKLFKQVDEIKNNKNVVKGKYVQDVKLTSQQKNALQNVISQFSKAFGTGPAPTTTQWQSTLTEALNSLNDYSELNSDDIVVLSKFFSDNINYNNFNKFKNSLEEICNI